MSGSEDETALLAIAANAQALLADAQLLFDQGRHPRAAALAVLAGEEAGKFWLVKWKPEGWKKKFYEHRDELAVGAAFQHDEGEGLVRSSTGGMQATYINAPSNPEWDQWVQRARAFGPVKEAGLYVDLDDAGTLISDPTGDVGENTATRCLSYARSEVDRVGLAEVVRKAGALRPRP